MSITLYDLAGAEADRRFSPFCWRTRMALAHKGLKVETVPWPVIVDDDRVVHDSTAIADHLEERYPDRPALFGGEIGRALARFVQNWTETVVLPGLIRLVLLDIHRRCAPEDQDYFRRARSASAPPSNRQCTTVKLGCRPSEPASIHCAEPSSGRILSPARRPPTPITSFLAPSNGRARSAISRCLRPMIRLGSGADACSTCSTASLVAPPPTATERALEYMPAAAGLARPWHD